MSHITGDIASVIAGRRHMEGRWELMPAAVAPVGAVNILNYPAWQAGKGGSTG